MRRIAPVRRVVVAGAEPRRSDLARPVASFRVASWPAVLLAAALLPLLPASAPGAIDPTQRALFGVPRPAPLQPARLAEAIGGRVVRFWPDSAARAEALPSLTLAAPVSAAEVPPGDFAVRPDFSSRQGERVARVRLPRGTTLYGTGEVMGPLLRNGRVTTCWNTDAYAYDEDTPSLYESHPWVLAVRPDGSACGLLADTPGRVTVDLLDDVTFRAVGPPFPVVVIEGESPQAVLKVLADLTGRLPLPPKWALGYQQCRYSYYPATQVLEVAREFRRRRIPCDVIWMDIDYMNGYRLFTFDPRGFPDPTATNDSLHAIGFRSVWIVDPGVKQDPGYTVFQEGSAGDHWVKTATGEDYVGRVWPGPCVFPDFTRAATRAWWAGRIGEFAATGADGIWNDMNEPAIFDVDSKTMPETNRHRADAELGGSGPHLRYHNVYGLLMARATQEGLLAARPERRPFVLTRAGFIGVQRYAACWTGDNRATWKHLAASVPMALNLGLSGQPMSGSDIGGFGGSPDGPLFARWMGVGTLLPFARAHSEKGSPRREPWSFGPEVEATCRRAIETRYRLLPYLYTLFREASVDGLPVARPVFFADPTDDRLRSEDRAFLLGADLLVVPELDDDSRLPMLPKGIWRQVELTPGRHDPDLPRLLLRGGSIMPLGPVMQYVDERPLDEVELLVCPDAQGRAEGVLYEDAGDGFGYRQGRYRLTRFTAQLEGAKLGVRATVIEGAWAPPGERRYRITPVAVGLPKDLVIEAP
jgi:alpha-glucosidase